MPYEEEYLVTCITGKHYLVNFFRYNTNKDHFPNVRKMVYSY